MLVLSELSPTLRAAALAIALSATACGGAPDEDAALPTGPAPETCTVATSPEVPEDDGVRAAHARAREVGAAQGRRDAADYIEDRTADGYRLRRVISTLAMGLGLFLVGGLLGALLLNLLGKRPSLRYAKRLGDAAIEAVAAIEGEGDGDGDEESPLAPLAEPLAHAERAVERLVDLAAPLESDRDGDLASARRGELYATLEALLGHLEALALEAEGWRARTDDEAVAAEVAAAAEALTARVEGAS